MAKRANGEGSIFKRADGTWSAELSYRDEHGAAKRRTVYGKTQTEVRAKMAQLRTRLDAGDPIKDTTMTVAAWLDDWISKALPASDRKQATIDLYASMARKHLVPVLGERRLDKIRPSDIEALVVTKRQAGLAQSTVRTIYTVLRSALTSRCETDSWPATRQRRSGARPSIGRTPAISRSTRPTGYSRRCGATDWSPCSA